MKLSIKVVLVALIGAIIFATAVNSCAQVVYTAISPVVLDYTPIDEPMDVTVEIKSVYEILGSDSDTLEKTTMVSYVASINDLAGVDVTSIPKKEWFIIVGENHSYSATAVIWRGPTDGLKRVLVIKYYKGKPISLTISSYKEEWVTEVEYRDY